jgi:DNA-binding transcriptional regulator GbsR (MarR family)
MKAERSQQALHHYIEKWGMTFEHLGASRMGGKILGWLLISDPPHQTAKQISDAIGASLASVSTTSRTLTQAALIERVGIPGERSAHFRVSQGMWARLMRYRLGRIAEMIGLAEEGLSLLPEEDRDLTLRLRELKSYCSFVENEFPGLLARWEKEWQKEQS